MYARKQRGKMFTAYETEVLMNIIKYYKNCGAIDPNRVNRPGAIVPLPWRKIQQEFFEKVGVRRDVESLKNKYKNFRKAMRKSEPYDPIHISAADMYRSPYCKAESPETPDMKDSVIPDILKRSHSFQNCLTKVEAQLDYAPQSPEIADTVDSGIPILMQGESLTLSKMEMERHFLEEEHKLRMKKLKLEMSNMQRESELRQEKLRLEIELLQNSCNEEARRLLRS